MSLVMSSKIDAMEYFLVAVCCAYLITVSLGDIASATYQLMKADNGSYECAIDEPFIIKPMESASMAGRCAVECTTTPLCDVYQFKENSLICELFDNVSVTFAVVPQCTCYAAIRDPCPGDFRRVFNYCFKEITSKETWFDANNTCLSLYPPYSHLVTIDSFVIQRAVNGFASSSYWTSGHRLLTPWFVWNPFPGTNISITYTNWSQFQPTNNVSQLCMHVFASGKWDDTSCWKPDYPLCEL